MRKLMISVLVAACVVGIFGTSLGAFSDTEGTKYSEAATVLSGLGLLKGYEDGTFKPANTITRAEFSAVAVRALGLEAAAAVAGATTVFSDVPATHWAAGYINICSDQGIIKGYADGTFKPEAPVTYAEVLAMIVRMLGYDPSVTGTWPTNYIVKAYDIGLAGGVTFAAGSPATRGDVALFVQKALTLPLMVQVWTGAITSYVVDPFTSLLGDKLGYESYTGYVDDYYTLFDTNLEENQASIDFTVFGIGDGVDFPPGWYGQLVKVWHDGETIVAAANKTAASDIVTGYFLDNAAGISVIVGGKTKTYDDASTIFARNNVWDTYPNTDSTVDPMAGDGDTVRVVLDDGWVVSIVGWTYDDSALLTKVDTKYNKLTGFNSDGSDFSKDLDDFDLVALEKGGKVVDVKGLAAGDLLYYDDAGATFWGIVSSTKVTGKIDSIDSDADGTSLSVGGSSYLMADPSTYSTDDNDSVLVFADTGGGIDPDESLLVDFDGATATLYLDAAGDVRHLSANLTETTTATKAIIKSEFYVYDNPDPEEVDLYYVYVYKLDGTTAKLELGSKTYFDEDADGGATSDYTVDDILVGNDIVDDAFPVGYLVSYTMKDNKVATITSLTETLGWEHQYTDMIGGAAPICDTDYNMFNSDGGSYRVSSNTLFIDYYNWKIRKWADFQNISIDTPSIDPAYLFLNDAETALVYCIYNGDDDTFGISYGTKSENMGVVTGRQTTSDGVKVKVLLPDGKIVSYLVEATTILTTCSDANFTVGAGEITELCSGDFVTFKVNGDYYTEITEEIFENDCAVGADGASGYVQDFDGDDLVGTLCDDLETPVLTWDYTFTLECLFYDVAGSAPAVAGAEDVADEQFVRVFDLDSDGLMDVFVIVD